MWLELENDRLSDARVGVTGATDHARRAHKTKDALKGNPLNNNTIQAAADLASDGLETLGDMCASSAYRAHLVNALAAQALHSAHTRAHGM